MIDPNQTSERKPPRPLLWRMIFAAFFAMVLAVSVALLKHFAQAPRKGGTEYVLIGLLSLNCIFAMVNLYRQVRPRT